MAGSVSSPVTGFTLLQLNAFSMIECLDSRPLQPVVEVAKEFMLSSHPLTVEANLDKAVSVCVGVCKTTSIFFSCRRIGT